MGRSRNPNKKTTEESIRESLQKEKEAFTISRKNFEAPKETSQSAREAFRTFWATSKKNYKNGKDLEDILWTHLVAAKFDKPELFEEGIKNFGLNK